MCRLLTPNLTNKASTLLRQTSARQQSTATERERERQGAAASRRILLRKKLSFSKALKNNSENSEDTTRTQMSEVDSNSTCENSVLHSTPSNERLSSVPYPLMMAIGLVRQSDLPLSWLDPTSVFSCNGLYVPRDTRNTLSRWSLSKERESSCRVNSADLLTEINNSPNPPGKTSTSEQSPSCILTSATLTPRTPTFLSMNLSPVVRLSRCLPSVPGSSHGNQSTSTNRRKRTASVPRDVLCSLSNNSMAGEENKENKTTITDTEKLAKIKISRSLPSSPVVLCTKLPLLRRQDSANPASLSLSVSPKLLQEKIIEAQDTASSTTVNETHDWKDNLVS